MLTALAIVLKELRAKSGVKKLRFATAVDLDPSQLTRFENGTSGWPRNPDQLVIGYAKVAGVSPLEVWDRAVKRAKQMEKDELVRQD